MSSSINKSLINDVIKNSKIRPSQKKRFLNEVMLKTEVRSSNPNKALRKHIEQIKVHIKNKDAIIKQFNETLKREFRKTDNDIKKEKNLLRNTINKLEEKEKELSITSMLLDLYQKRGSSISSSISIDPTKFSVSSSINTSRTPVNILDMPLHKFRQKFI